MKPVGSTEKERLKGVNNTRKRKEHWDKKPSKKTFFLPSPTHLRFLPSSLRL